MRAITQLHLDDITFDINTPSMDNTVTNTTPPDTIVEAPVYVDPTIVQESNNSNSNNYSNTNNLVDIFTRQNSYNNIDTGIGNTQTNPVTATDSITSMYDDYMQTPTTSTIAGAAAPMSATATSASQAAVNTAAQTANAAQAATTNTTQAANAATATTAANAAQAATATAAANAAQVATAKAAAQTPNTPSANTYEAIFNKIKHDESNGNYGAFGDIGDGAGITAGAYQFTEKSGKLAKLARMLGINTRKMTRKQWLAKLKTKLNTPEGIKAQDTLFYNSYARTAVRIAKKYGIKDARVIHFLIDTNVNGGLQNVISRAKRMGGLTLTNLKKARIARYRYLASRNPRYKKFLKGWINRVKRI